jgi:hypothetical protein
MEMELEKTSEQTEQKQSKDLEAFFKYFHEENDAEKKIALAIQYMQTRLFDFPSPKFREFWEIRKLCLPFFKENMPPKNRADLWQQYVDLALEARRIKEILDEKSSFAYEQIDLAIQSLLGDLSIRETAVAAIEPIDIPEEAKTLFSKREKYILAQRNLQFLNTLATRLNSLRKEVVKIDMKVRSKAKLFEKLSSCGDEIFPKRKEWIKTLSDDFIEDVECFAKLHFDGNKPPRGSLFPLKEEVKALQSLAKVLTMNTYAFTETRIKLSSCWDMLKEWDKEKRKEIQEKKEHFQKNFESFSPKVQEFVLWCAEDVSFEEVEVKYKELFSALRHTELDRQDSKSLEQQMQEARRPHEEKRERQLQEMQERDKELEKLRVEKIQGLHATIESLLQRAESLSVEEIRKEQDEWEENYRKMNCSKAEKVLLDRLHKKLKDKMLEVKKSSLLKLSTGEREGYEALVELLEEKKERRQEVKQQLEAYRKILGGSSLDFEKALAYQELVKAERETLEKMTLAIEEIEEKLEEIALNKYN